MAVWSVLLLAVACTPNEDYSKMHTISQYEWHRSDSLDFDVFVDDTTAVYDLYITIRHNNDYDFSNLWFYLHTNYPSGKSGHLRKQVKLADNKALKWTGECMNTICSAKFPIVRNLHLSEVGQYQFRINHVMRTNPLRGVMDVGLHLAKKGRHDAAAKDTDATNEGSDKQPKLLDMPQSP